MVLIGYDAEAQRFLCLDPAFPSDAETFTAYPQEALLAAWRRNGQYSYLFREAPCA